MTATVFFGGLVSVFVGFFLARFFSGEESGMKGKCGALRIKVKDYIIHVHHWLYGGFLIMGFHHFFQTHPWPDQIILYGFLAGVVIQGLTYRDFYRIVYKESNFNASAGDDGSFLMDY